VEQDAYFVVDLPGTEFAGGGLSLTLLVARRLCSALVRHVSGLLFGSRSAHVRSVDWRLGTRPKLETVRDERSIP